MIEAIVLAAGRSKRMGRPKALLPFGGETFLGHIIAVLRDCDIGRITVVVGADAEVIRNSVDLSMVAVAVNENYEQGQLSSLIVGLDAISVETEAVLMCLVDMPFVSRPTVEAIIRAFNETNAPIVVPVFEGRRGHPVLFAKMVFDELRNAPLNEGARHVVHANAARLAQVESADRGILTTINTPQQYKSRFGHSP